MKPKGQDNTQPPFAVGEFALIARLTQRLGQALPPGVVGIGDDTAGVPLTAIPQGQGFLLLTCDMAVAGRHFHPQHTPPEDVGWRVATANVSDVVACGGQPAHALVSLGVPQGQDPVWLERLYAGLAQAAQAYGFVVLGGNVSAAAELLVDVFLTGFTPKFVARRGAKPGDALWVSGPLGDAAAGLEVLLAGQPPGTPDAQTLLARHLRPQAQLTLAPLLVRLASAAIDISDGLSSELHHLAQASGVRLEVQAARLPCSAELARYAQARQQAALPYQLHGGEGYQVLFTAPPAAADELAAWGAVCIGQVTAGQGVLLDGVPLVSLGFDHLR